MTVVRFFNKQIFLQFGVLLELVNDQGVHFLNEVVKEMITKYLVNHRRMTPYHPKVNGLTKRENSRKDHGEILKKTMVAHKMDWDIKLVVVVFAYN